MIENGQVWKRNGRIIRVLRIVGSRARVQKDGEEAITVPLPELWDLLQKHEFKVRPSTVDLAGVDYDRLGEILGNVALEERPVMLLRAYKERCIDREELWKLMVDRLTTDDHVALAEEMKVKPYVFPFEKEDNER